MRIFLRTWSHVKALEGIGLCLNNGKSVIIWHMSVTILCSLPGVHVVDTFNACLLGMPLGCLESISAILMGKINSLNWSCP